MSEMCIHCTYKLIGGWGMNIFNDGDVKVRGLRLLIADFWKMVGLFVHLLG